MVHFVGAGPGAPDLITLRGAQLLKKADCIIYAGSLVNPALLEMAKEGCEIHNSAAMTLEEVLEVMFRMEAVVCLAPSGSRWTRWTKRALPMTIPPAFPAFAVRRQL